MRGMYGRWMLSIRCSVPSRELCLFRGLLGPTTAHVDRKGITDGLWRGEMKCISPKAKDADVWTLTWEEVRSIHQEGTLPEVVHAD